MNAALPRAGLSGTAQPPAAASTGLDKARARFRSLILERILALEACRQSVITGDAPETALTSISDLAHKISGVGATLGFVEAGGLAGLVERTILQDRQRLSQPAQFQKDLEPLLETLLVALESLIED